MTAQPIRLFGSASGAVESGRAVHISIRNLSKSYGKFVALESASLDVHRGEFICLIGPSGCGKSTILQIVAGLVRQTSGVLEFWSDDGNSTDYVYHGEIGMVFQTSVLFPWKDVIGNVMLPAVLRGDDFTSGRARARELLAMVGLKEFETRTPRELSGGMQQRVAICRSLMCNSDILLMDEPFGALDALTRDELALELKRICEVQKKTVIFVTHSIPEAVFLGDRIVVMGIKPGRVKRIITVDLDRSSGLPIMETAAFQSKVSMVRDLITARHT